MTPYARGAKPLLINRRQLPSTASWTLSKPSSFSKLPRVAWNFHRQSLNNSTRQAWTNNIKKQFPSLVLPPIWPPEKSKRDPVPASDHDNNEADLIARHMLSDGFQSWGLVVYRCTYKSDSDWEEFMRRFLYHVNHTLEYADGLDLLDYFKPTVMDDKTRFDGVSPAIVRDYFNQWAHSACETEQGIPFNRASQGMSARYRLCIMVDEEALLSVLSIPPEEVEDGAFVILIEGRWKPRFLTEEELEGCGSPPPENNFEPVEGCTLEEVGWMKVDYKRAQIGPSAHITSDGAWADLYVRPPEMTFPF
ncbi:uncharacterized protein BHQ10_006277 [Talaromyces amestolkiae]|uniref:Uncharacterized protein n=1 Tax=Talaromyces amestolkiae TaxID=1196081 RepID=A0A364L382_TALAM|nr:uncharacterized protein BHQ10_006277 [Talaromyces amestolkiae]RAO70265.1 hypothetical protein BHQ10_006277 [Talaromyces amestolkiae]